MHTRKNRSPRHQRPLLTDQFLQQLWTESMFWTGLDAGRLEALFQEFNLRVVTEQFRGQLYNAVTHQQADGGTDGT